MIFVVQRKFTIPRQNTFTPTGNLVVERAGNTATLLADGRVLITGGEDRQENKIANAEIYDPSNGRFTADRQYG